MGGPAPCAARLADAVACVTPQARPAPLAAPAGAPALPPTRHATVPAASNGETPCSCAHTGAGRGAGWRPSDAARGGVPALVRVSGGAAR